MTGLILRKALPSLLLLPLAVIVGNPAGAAADNEHNESHRLQLTIDAPDMAHAGDTVDYRFLVTNTGHATLHDIAVVDSVLGVIGTIDRLHGGDSAEPLTKSFSIPADQKDDIADTASACAKVYDSSDQNDTCTEGGHVLKVIQPAIRLRMSADRSAATSGDSVTFQYAVTNTGDVALHDVDVVDGKLGRVGQVGSLDPGESKTFSRKVDVDLSTVTRRSAEAGGTDPLGLDVSDRDDLEITVAAPPTTTTTTTTTATTGAINPPTVTPQVLGEQLTNPAPAPAGQLPRTGSNLITLFAAGLTLCLGGQALLTTARRA